MEKLFELVMALGLIGSVFAAVLFFIVKKLIYLCDPNEVLIFSGNRASGRDGMAIGYRIIFCGRA